MHGSSRSFRSLRLVVVSLAILGISAFAYTVVSTKITLDWRAAYAKQLAAAALPDINRLADRVNGEQDFYLRITPGADYVLQQPVGLVAFDSKGFPEEFVSGLIPALDHGCPTYTIVVAEDPATRALIVYNAEGKAIYAIHPFQGYDPYRLLNQLHPNLASNRYTSEQSARLRLEYDPARVQIVIQLIPSDWIEAYAEARYETLADRTLAALGIDEGGGAGMMMRLPAADSNIVIQAITVQTNETQLEIGYPDSFTNRLEIFSSTDLVAFVWTLAATNLSTAGTNTIWWTDPDTNRVLRFYAVGNADEDSDADGLTDAREKYLYHTSMTNEDTDGDEMPDGWETQYQLDPLSDDALQDPDGDGYWNIYEAKRGSQPNASNSVPTPTQVVTNGGTAIQTVINDVTQDYAVVQVKAGTYTGSDNRNIDFGGKKLMLVSESGGTNTIINVQRDNGEPAFHFDNGEGHWAVVKGFTISNAMRGVALSGASPWINQCIITHNAFEGGVIAFNSAALLTDCVIQNNQGVSGAGITVSGTGSLVVANTVIRDNSSSSTNGGGIQVTGGNAAFINCTITRNTCAAGRGGGVYISGTTNASLLIQSCQITSNSAQRGGGLYGSSPATLSGTVVRANLATYGGGVCVSNTSAVAFSIQSCLISSNSAATSGGGIQAEGAATISGTVVCSNAAEWGGGALLRNVGGSGPFLDEVDLTNNGGASNLLGGGLYLDSSVVVTMRACRVNGNTSQGNGGGIYAMADLVFTNGELRGNRSVGGAGGGIYLMNLGRYPTVVEASTLAENVATNGGGGAYVFAAAKLTVPVTNDGRVVFRACTVADNSALTGGGLGYYGVASSGLLQIASCDILDNQARGEGGGVAGDGTNVLSLTDCLVMENRAYSAAGLQSAHLTLQVERSVIASNMAQNAYGGFSAGSNSYASIASTLISGNGALTNGGAGHCGTGVLQNCTVVDNWVSNSPAVGGLVAPGSNVTIRNTILWGNGSAQLSGAPRVSHSCVQGGWTTNGAANIVSSDPLLVDGYHLMNSHSPCLNAGTTTGLPTTDIDGNPRQSGSAPDIGCDELTLDDNDLDAMPDEWERYYFGASTNNNGATDEDGDGLPDAQEYAEGASPLDGDSDGDGLPDLWEMDRGLTPWDASDAAGDWNGDGLSNAEELSQNALAVRVTVDDLYHDDDVWRILLNGHPVASGRPGSGVGLIPFDTVGTFTLQFVSDDGIASNSAEYEVSFAAADYASGTLPWVAVSESNLTGTLPHPHDTSGIHWTYSVPRDSKRSDAKVGEPTCLSKEPINTLNGAITFNETDLAIPSPGFDLAFERSYNSKAATGVLGQGWAHSLEWSLATVTNAAHGDRAGAFKVLHAGDGSRYWFFQSGGLFLPPPDANLALVFTNDEFRVLWPGGRQARFDTNGVIQRLEDGFGQGLSFSNAAGTLAAVTHDNGRAVTFTYAGDRLVRVDSPSTNLYLSFAYDVDGRLTNVTRVADGSAQTEQYDYEELCGALTQKVSAAGDVFVYTVGYVTNSPATTSTPAVVTARGVGMALNPASAGWYTHTLNYTNPGGFRTRVTYDRGDTNLVHEYSYDPVKAWVDSITGPGTPGTAVWSNTWTRFKHDTAGNVTNTLAQDGASGQSLASIVFYDARHNPFSNAVSYCGNAATNWWTYQWDTNDLVAGRPAGGLLMAVSDPAGHKTAFDYTNGFVNVVRTCTNGTSGFETRLYYSTNGLLLSVTNANGHGLGYEYDAGGYVSRVVPALGPDVRVERNDLGRVTAVILPSEAGPRTNALTVNALGQVTAVTHPDGLTESFAFDALGHLTNRVDTAGRTNRLTWHPTGKPASVSQWLDGPTPTNVTISFDYDKQFNTLKITDPMGRPVESYKLDAQDRPIAVTNLASQVMTLNWGVGDYVSSITRFDSTVVTNLYGADGRLSSRRYPGETNTFAWTANGLPANVTGKLGAVSNAFDAVDRLTYQRQIVGTRTNIVTWQFDPAGNVTNVAVSNTFIRCGWIYDAAERPLTLTAQAASNRLSVFQWTYNTNNGLVASVTNAAVGEFLGYDIMDRATNILWKKANGTTNRNFVYAFNDAGMITNMIRDGTNSSVYTYDSLDRLTSETTSSGITNVWSYDLAGNRTMAISNGVTNVYTYAGGNALTNFGANTSVRYDAAGNVTNLKYSASRTNALSWSGRYELTEVRTNGVSGEKYDYDALGRRVRIVAGTTTNTLVYDGPHVVAEWSNSVLVRSYAYGPGIDDVRAMTTYGTATNTYYYLKDHLGSVHALVSTNGTVVEQYRYTAWGETTVMNATGGVLMASAYGNRVAWQGREISWASRLYYFRARWYDPVTGRWLSNDPIGISGGLNMYCFCGNNPVNLRDPSGLLWENVDVYGSMSDMATAGYNRGGVSGAVQANFYNGMTAVLDVIGGSGVKSTAGLSGAAVGRGDIAQATGWMALTGVQAYFSAVGLGGAGSALKGIGRGTEQFASFRNFNLYERGSGLLPKSIFDRMSYLDPIQRGRALSNLSGLQQIGLTLRGLLEPSSVWAVTRAGPTAGGVAGALLSNLFFNNAGSFLHDALEGHCQ